VSDRTFYIVDLRPEWNGNPYVTFWRANDAGYAYPLSWAGEYAEDKIKGALDYYTVRQGRSLIRFPVATDTIWRVRKIKPAKGVVDGDAGPVIRNTPANRLALRRASYRP